MWLYDVYKIYVLAMHLIANESKQDLIQWNIYSHSMYKGYRIYIWQIYSLQGRINEIKERNCVTRRKYGVDVA